MGETVLPTVEESSPQLDEPPICGLNEPHNTHQQRQLQPKASDGNAPPALHAPHTLSFQEVAEELRVDIK
jgi:Na+-exporting ATPase